MWSRTNMKILYVCAELFPYVKTGGLADASNGLASALRVLGCDVRFLLPAFPSVVQQVGALHRVADLPLRQWPWRGTTALPPMALDLARPSDLDVPLYLLNAPAFFDRPGNPYCDAAGHDWSDNALRFAAFSWLAAVLGQGLDADWVPDVIHCHDWHSGLTPAYGRAFAEAGQTTPASVFTIHNLGYQGLFPGALFPQLGLPANNFDLHGVEFFGQVSFIKAALQYADALTTVSPTYAREIMTPALGCGLDGLLRERAEVLTGILNGVDYRVWNPATDALLATHYDVDSLAKKSKTKRALQIDFGLEPRADALLFGVVSRLTEQKGLHLLPPLLTELVRLGGQLVLLGQGDASLEQVFVQAAQRQAGQVGVRIGYDEASAHRVIAGADVIVLPSAFEPCGLTQLYGLRYGTLPLVRRVGGLADSVVDCTPEHLADGRACGFVFDDLSATALLQAMRRALALARRPQQWAAVQAHAMALRFDWSAAAQHYLAVYQSLRPGQ